MIARVACGVALMLAAAGHSGTFAQSANPSDALLGCWDLVVQRGTQTTPSWLEVELFRVRRRSWASSWAPAAARVPSGTTSSPTVRFDSPSRRNGTAIRATSPSRGASRAIASPDSMTMGDGQTVTWSGTRAPSLRRKAPPVWADPVTLFNGQSVDGWQPLGRGDSQWSAVGGVLKPPRAARTSCRCRSSTTSSCTSSSACPRAQTAASTCAAVTSSRSTMLRV